MSDPIAVTEKADVINNPGGEPEGQTKTSKYNADFFSTAMKRFRRAMTVEKDNRDAGIDDLRFKAGDQWPANVKAEREQQKRPCLTINKMKTFVHQVTNNQRQNRPAITVSPIGDGSDKSVATMLRGLIRQIERQSDADVAYDTGMDNAVSNGWGYWRVLTEFESDDSFDQVIKVERIRNPFRVYLDPDHQMPDGSDAKWAFISDLVPRAEFTQQYPSADPVSWTESGDGDETMKDWSTLEYVRVSEYFYEETERKKLIALPDGSKVFREDLGQEQLDALAANPELIARQRWVTVKKIKWCKMTAREVIEESEWLGKWIPIVKVIGDEVDCEGRVIYSGVIRDAKDPQRMKNYWATAKTELIALAPKAPYILEEGQVEGHENQWNQANVKSFPYLLYKGTNVGGKQAPAPRREPFAGPPTGVIEAEQSAEQDMMGTTGVRFDATKSEKIPDESGRALRELKMLGEMGSYHYIDNLARSLKHTGRILVDLIPKVYDTRRVLTILREDGSEEKVVIEPNLEVPHQTAPGPRGEVQKLYNPTLGKYEVAVTIGPSYDTKRQEASDSMIQFIRFVPQAAPLISDLIAKNQDWPGAEQIAQRLSAMLPPQILEMDKSDLPPEAKAQIVALKGQMQQMHQQMQQMGQALQEAEQDTQVQIQKISSDYETKMEAIQQKHIEAVEKLASQERISERDYDVKMTKIAADLRVDMANLMQEKMGLIVDQITSAREAMEKRASEAAERETGEREPKERETPKMPDIHIYMPSGKKKITGPAGKTYISEDVEE